MKHIMCTEQIKQIVYEMLTENTGKALCDSGGYPEYDEKGKYVRSTQGYGRHWERHKGKTIEDFEKEIPEIIELDRWGLSRYVSVYHYLTTHSNLILDDICDKFNESNLSTEDWFDCDYWGVTEKGFNCLQELDVSIERVWNTYNGDSDLSQTLQGQELSIDGESYVLIQTHNGCDVKI